MTDPVLLEIHGMVQRMDQKMDDTMTTLSKHINSDEERFKPVEELNLFLRIGWKIGAGIVGLLGVGGTIAWIKSAAHVAVP